MSIGRTLPVEQEVDRSGEIHTRTVPHPGTAPSSGETDMRRHVTLADLQANIVRRIELPVPFTKFRVTVRDPLVNAYIGIGRPSSSPAAGSPGQYDDMLPGGNVLEDRCEPTTEFYIVVDAVPGTPVEVNFYAGAPARPI